VKIRILSLFILVASLARAAEEQPVILYEADPTLLTTTIQVVVMNGSADDPQGKAGLSALMGEMILRGTAKRNRSQFQSEVERLGASVAVATSYDMTSFYGAVIKENTDAFLKLFEETLWKPAFPPSEFEPLRRETLAEVAHLKNNNMRLAGLALRKELLGGTPLEHPGSGTISSLKRIQLADAVKMYGQDFNRNNMLIAVASPLKEAELRPKLIEMWKKFPAGKKKERKYVQPKALQAPKLVLVQKPKTATGSLMFGQPGITAQDPLRYVLGTSNFMFGGEPLVSRLFKVVRSELGWTYSIGSTYQAIGQLMSQQGVFVISSTPAVEYTSKSMLKIRDMWKEYLTKGLAGEELELAQDSLVNSYPFEFDESRKRLANLVRSHVYGVPILTPEQFDKEIRGVSNETIRKGLAERQSADGWLISLVADKAVIEKQLAEEQKDIPAEKRLTIAKVYTPEQLIE
jgi:zinc protease